MSVEVEFVGGPHDGRRVSIDGNPLSPPEILHAVDLPQLIDVARVDNPVEPETRLVYWRTTHAAHVWRYQYGKPA
jgi:hypothetical protein